jgi:hypothetical protein
VRRSQTVDEAGGSGSQREAGCSSDLKEIVAVMERNSSWRLTKEFKFAFLGSELTGIMGEKWKIMVVMTGV